MYNLVIWLYAFFVRLIAPFHTKAGKMVRGHRATYRILREQIEPSADYVWIHVSSLGEFEQARPIIETLKRDYPSYKILLSFFSPSGYEVRKDYPLADVVCYLPFDKKKNVRKFIDLAQPKMALFVKYEFWYNFIHALYQREIPIYLVSAIFRPEQLFFKKRSGAYGKILYYYTHIFVQDEQSAQLLAGKQITNVTVTGDTRIDRVIEIQQNAKQLPIVESFIGDKRNPVFIAGSAWPADETVFMDYFNTHPQLKMIVAPHEMDAAHLEDIERKFARKSIRYTQANKENVKDCDCLIVDCFGLLSSIYRYGDIAYIGGGFGVGIHNLPEAAVYGIPVIFGTNYRKFREAHGLIAAGGGFSVVDKNAFETLMNSLLQSPTKLHESGKRAEQYIIENAGATKKIFRQIGF